MATTSVDAAFIFLKMLFQTVHLKRLKHSPVEEKPN